LLLRRNRDGTSGKGYGSDPDLSKFYQPGDFWPLTFNPAHRETAAALADLILPADHLGPAASKVRVPEYLDESVSAPYPPQPKSRRDRIRPSKAARRVAPALRERFRLVERRTAARQRSARQFLADPTCWPRVTSGKANTRQFVR
jgi:hypothetical protein